MERNRHAAPRKTFLVTLAAVAGIVFVYASFRYNRGSIVAPLRGSACGLRRPGAPHPATGGPDRRLRRAARGDRGSRLSRPDTACGTLTNEPALKRIVNKSDFNEELQSYAVEP